MAQREALWLGSQRSLENRHTLCCNKHPGNWEASMYESKSEGISIHTLLLLTAEAKCPEVAHLRSPSSYWHRQTCHSLDSELPATVFYTFHS